MGLPAVLDQFLGVLEEIDGSRALLLNDLAIVRWNLDKSYMRDVAARGDDIVPSSWYDGFSVADVAGYFVAHDVDKVVIKPTVGGNALDTFILTNPVPDDMLKLLAERFTGRPYSFSLLSKAFAPKVSIPCFFSTANTVTPSSKRPGQVTSASRKSTARRSRQPQHPRACWT